uniref:ATPase H+ transporting V0 subunit d1 n=1 Tax=Oryctolagus cuniculus TaxID=9986 RepID=A0A5F9C2I0_RABIT
MVQQMQGRPGAELRAELTPGSGDCPRLIRHATSSKAHLSPRRSSPLCGGLFSNVKYFQAQTPPTRILSLLVTVVSDARNPGKLARAPHLFLAATGATTRPASAMQAALAEAPQARPPLCAQASEVHPGPTTCATRLRATTRKPDAPQSPALLGHVSACASPDALDSPQRAPRQLISGRLGFSGPAAPAAAMSFFPELYFNVDNGYLEGLVRGLKAGVLSQADYLNLVQCETLEDLKLHLQSTDYGNFLANEASPLTVSVIDDRLKEKMVVEFRHMRNHAYEPLASFLDFITYSYMIDNVILLITGTLHQRSIAELVPKCHPLGSFEQMEAVNIAQTPAELYNAILVDTPLAAFFQDCISEQDLDEMNIEIIRNTLYKIQTIAPLGRGLAGHREWSDWEIPRGTGKHHQTRPIWSPSTSSAPCWVGPQLMPCAPSWSLKQIAAPSSSPSTPLARSCPRKTEPSCSRTAGGSTLRAWPSWLGLMTMSRSRTWPITTQSTSCSSRVQAATLETRP